MGKGKKDKAEGPPPKKPEELIAMRETILAYKLEVRSNACDQIEVEATNLIGLNETNTERNKKLKKEHFENFQKLLQQAKDLESQVEQNQIYNSSQVEQALKEKWSLIEQEDKNVEELLDRLKTLEKETAELEEIVQMLIDMRDFLCIENEKKIKALEADLVKLEKEFHKACELLQKQIKAAFDEIDEKAEKRIIELRNLASDRAIEKLDEKTLSEVQENRWMKKEAIIHRTESVSLEEEVEKLETRNLKMIADLLKSQKDQLKASTDFCPEKGVDSTHVILGDRLMSLENISIYSSELNTPTSSTAGDKDRSCACAAKPPLVKREICGVGSSNDISVEFKKKIMDSFHADININDESDFVGIGPMAVKQLQIAGNTKPIYSVIVNDDEIKEELNSRAKWEFVSQATYKSILEKDLTSHAE